MPGKILHLEDFALGGFCLLIFAGGFCTWRQMNREILCVYYCWRILCVTWPEVFCVFIFAGGFCTGYAGGK